MFIAGCNFELRSTVFEYSGDRQNEVREFEASI
jgi:hypothetical protein